ncbi:hypothetical protein ACG7TL_004358 [Trametes sanguinea]
MHSPLPLDWLPVAGFLAALLLLCVFKRFSGSTRPLPPGPKPLPLIGNALDFPATDWGQAFRDLTLKYGELVYLNMAGQPIVLLGTHEAAVELLEKRSSIYSDRNQSTMVSLTGWDWLMAAFTYGPWWRRHRRALHQFFTLAALRSYGPMQELEARRLAYRLVKDPDHFLAHIRRWALLPCYMLDRHQIPEDDDEYLLMTEQALESFHRAFKFGKYLVETFPILRFLPSWFPGAKFQREAKVWKPRVHKLRDVPWEQALETIRAGTGPPSMTAALMQRVSRFSGDERVEEEVVARNVAGVAYAAGVDTTIHCIEDKIAPESTSLLTPLGMPHRSSEDDQYQGYFIPKGTLVIANMWWYSHDPERYPEPDVFNPERFLKDGEPDPDALDPADIAFGYGRRICPGRHFADTSLFLSLATVLHTLSISAPLGANGQPINMEGKMTTGLVS